MRNKLVMNCEQCGRLVSFQTSGEVMKGYSDLDGQLCIVAMWCKRCAANRREHNTTKAEILLTKEKLVKLMVDWVKYDNGQR